SSTPPRSDRRRVRRAHDSSRNTDRTTPIRRATRARAAVPPAAAPAHRLPPSPRPPPAAQSPAPVLLSPPSAPWVAPPSRRGFNIRSVSRRARMREKSRRADGAPPDGRGGFHRPAEFPPPRGVRRSRKGRIHAAHAIWRAGTRSAQEVGMDTTTSYLGLRLAHPFIAGASPMGYSLDTIKRLEDAGAAAIVLHSLFEE